MLKTSLLLLATVVAVALVPTEGLTQTRKKVTKPAASVQQTSGRTFEQCMSANAYMRASGVARYCHAEQTRRRRSR